jgi:hypothetical protein
MLHAFSTHPLAALPIHIIPGFIMKEVLQPAIRVDVCCYITQLGVLFFVQLADVDVIWLSLSRGGSANAMGPVLVQHATDLVTQPIIA